MTKYLRLNTKYLELGFTLIELLVVISIIGILVSLIAASYTQAQRQARDSQRKSDTKQYQAGLEQYANNTAGGTYPIATSTAAAMCTAANSLLALGYVSACPDYIGTNSTYRYQYVSGDGLTYYVYFQSESKASNWFVVCSNGRTGERATVPVGAACPLP